MSAAHAHAAAEGEQGSAAARPSLAHRVEHLGYRASGALLRVLDHRGAVRFGRCAGGVFWWAAAHRRRVTLDNVARVFPELPPPQRRRIARRSTHNFGRFVLEDLFASHVPVEEIRRRFDVVGEEHLVGAREPGRGLILLTGHFGPFDLAAYLLVPVVGEIHVVFRPPSNPLVDAEVRRVRERTGAILVPRRRAAQRLLPVVRRGGVLATAIDQRVNPFTGILVDFLGRPAWTSPIPALLQRRTGATVVPFFVYPPEAGRYRLEIDPPVSDGALGDDPDGELTRRYLEPLERRIRRDPELWMWLHERWQVVFRHRDPRVRERIARESGLTRLAPIEERPTSLPGAARRVLDRRFLESCRAVSLQGERAAVRSVARALVASALAEGWAARAEHAAALAERLRDAERRGRLGAELRELDRRPLVWIEGLEEIEDGDARRLLALQIERRSGRGSLVLDGTLDRDRDDSLTRALDRASREDLRVEL